MNKMLVALSFTIIFLFPSIAPCGDLYYTQEGYLIAVSEETFNICLQMGLDGDDAAFQQMWDAGLCVISRAGIPIYVVDWHFGTIEFRMQGDTQVFWGMSELIGE